MSKIECNDIGDTSRPFNTAWLNTILKLELGQLDIPDCIREHPPQHTCSHMNIGNYSN